MIETYYRCYYCERITDYFGKPVKLSKEKLEELQKKELVSIRCRDCTEYFLWEHDEYFANSSGTERDSNPQ